MKKSLLITSLLLLCAHPAHSDSFKNLLKESLKQALQNGQPTEASPTPTSPVVASPTNTTSPPPSAPAPVLSATDQALMNQGLWRDPKTDLIWQRCALGQTWDGTQCGGEALGFTWIDAVMHVKNLSLAGNSDWRIPTKQELLTVFHCVRYGPQQNNGGCRDSDETPVLPSYDEKIFPIHPPLADGAYPGNIKTYTYWTSSINGQPDALAHTDAITFTEHGSTGTENIRSLKEAYVYGFQGYQLLLVRGGNPDGFNKAVYMAQQQLQAIEQEKKDEIAQKERYRQEREAENAAAAKRYQLEQERAAQAEKAYQAKTVEFRKRVKAGDRTVNGLVLEVKGELVKVQRYARQCVTTYGATCIRYDNVVVGEEWQRRSEIQPPR